MGDLKGADDIFIPWHFIDISHGFAAEEFAMRPWAEDLFKKRVARFSADDPQARCKPLGIPRLDVSPLPLKIVQTPGLTFVLSELDFTFRQIYTDGRPPVKDTEPSHMGYTTARWEGATLVAETAGFGDQGWLDAVGHPHSDQLHLVERFQRPDFGHLELTFTIDDPKAYVKPFTVVQKFHFLPDSDLLEYFCSDNEAASRHFVLK